MPWVELQIGFDNCVHIVNCKLFSKVEHKNQVVGFKKIFILKTCQS